MEFHSILSAKIGQILYLEPLNRLECLQAVLDLVDLSQQWVINLQITKNHKTKFYLRGQWESN